MVKRSTPDEYFNGGSDHTPFYALIALLGLFALVLGVAVIYRK